MTINTEILCTKEEAERSENHQIEVKSTTE